MEKVTNKMIFALLMFLNISQIYAKDSNSNLTILWQKEYSANDNITSAPHIATFDKKTNKIVIVGSSFRPIDPNFRGKMWIWEITQDGEKTKETILKEATKKECSAIGDLWPTRGLKISENGDTFMVGNFGKLSTKEASLLKINNQKTEKKTMLIADKNQKEEDILILKMINLLDGNILLVGKDSNGSGLIIKVDSQGNRLWKKAYTFGRNNIFTDGIPLKEKGEFLVVGLSFLADEDKDTTIMTPNICMVKYNSKGEMLSENMFPGGTLSPYAYPQACLLDSGNFVVIYDKSKTMKSTDRWFEIFTPALEPLQKKQISKSANTLAFSGIESIPNRDFLIADWLESSGLTVYQYDDKGNEVGKVSVKDTTVFGSFNINVVCTEEKGFVVLCGPFQGSHTKAKIIALELIK